MRTLVISICFLLVSCSSNKPLTQEAVNEMPNDKRIELCNRYVGEGQKNMKLLKYDIACGDFREALMLKPSDDEIMKSLAYSYYYLGLYDSAIVYMEAKIAHKSDDHVEYILLSYMYKKKDNSKKALEYIDKAIALNENEPTQYFYAAEIYYKEHDKDSAIKYLQLFQNKYAATDFTKLSEKKKETLLNMNDKSTDLLNILTKKK